MATHQSLGGMTDEALLKRMLDIHSEKYDEVFWSFFNAEVLSTLPDEIVAVDLGCGPGLFLHELASRCLNPTLYGYDVTQAMVDYAMMLEWPREMPTLSLHDVGTQLLPLTSDSVHLLCMTSVLHIIDNPLFVLKEIRRVLTQGGIFFLNDWIRHPLKDYLDRRAKNQSEEGNETLQLSGLRLFPVHNKFTVEDWEWLLSQAGFDVRSYPARLPTHQIFISTV